MLDDPTLDIEVALEAAGLTNLLLNLLIRLFILWVGLKFYDIGLLVFFVLLSCTCLSWSILLKSLVFVNLLLLGCLSNLVWLCCFESVLLVLALLLIIVAPFWLFIYLESLIGDFLGVNDLVLIPLLMPGSFIELVLYNYGFLLMERLFCWAFPNLLSIVLVAGIEQGMLISVVLVLTKFDIDCFCVCKVLIYLFNLGMGCF